MEAVDNQFVTLCLGAEVFAVPVSMVREILDYRDSFRIPDGPDYLLGLIDVRGRGTPVIDLRSKLGMAKVPPDSATRIMVLDVPLADRTLALGLVADRVLEVATFTEDQIEGAPDVGVAWRSDYIAGVVRREGGFVVLFNLSKLLTADMASLNALNHMSDAKSRPAA
jgi:Chemotaxis signal transduction protein